MGSPRCSKSEPPGGSLGNADAVPEEVDELLQDLHGRGGLTFTSYQRLSLLRRIRSRMKQVGAAGFPAYRAYLAADPAEHARLCEAVSVHRTEFCRDTAAWAYLAAEAIPSMLAGKAAGEPVRVWSAGCSSGEEAYTLAAVLANTMGLSAFQERATVFSTDVSRRVVTAAADGCYTAARMDVASPEVQKYFQRADSHWVVRPALRARMVFSQQDLLRDVPFSRIDLIACRNTLMYFTESAQMEVLAGFYLALREGGVLFTGRAESVELRTDLFWADCRPNRVYRKAGGRQAKAFSMLARRGRAWDMPTTIKEPITRSH